MLEADPSSMVSDPDLASVAGSLSSTMNTVWKRPFSVLTRLGRTENAVDAWQHLLET